MVRSATCVVYTHFIEVSDLDRDDDHGVPTETGALPSSLVLC